MLYSRIALLLAMGLIAGIAIAADGEPDELQRLVTIEYDPALLGFSHELLSRVPQAEGFLSSVERKVLGTASRPSKIQRAELAELRDLGYAYLCQLTVRYGPTIDQATRHKLWEAVRGEAEAALQGIQDAAQDGKERELQMKKEVLLNRRHRAEKNLNEHLEVYLELVGSARSPATIRRQLSEVRMRRWEVKSGLVVLEAKKMAIEDRIDELRKDSMKTVGDDEIIRELARLVQLRKEELRATQSHVDAGEVTHAAIRRAEAALVQAKVELLRERNEAARRAGLGQLDKLNSELSDLVIESAEKRARLNQWEQRVAQLRSELVKQLALEHQLTRKKQPVDLWQKRVMLLQTREVALEDDVHFPRRVAIRLWGKREP